MPDNLSIFEVLSSVAVLIVLALLVYAVIVFVVRMLARVLPATSPRPDPGLDALRIRFANGEIDEIEYQRLRAFLQRR
jgi:uncharacterized membrane protein